MFLVWMRRISRRPVASGMPMSISRSKRPKRRRAGSIELGRLVAAMTTTLERALRPSMSVSSCDTTRRSTSPLVFSRLGAMASISSMKMMAGECFSASSNALRRFDSDSPASFDMISGPLIRKKNAPVSLATARAMSVLPVPGGPKRRMPRGGLMPIDLNSCGWRSGSSTSSRIWAICLRTPPMSSYPTSDRFCSSSSRLIGSPSVWIIVSGATMQYGLGSHSTTLNSTARMAARTRNRSPLRTGRYASRKYGLRNVSNRLPVRPSIVSSIGRMCTRWPYLMSGQGWTETMSPRRTRRLLRTTLLTRTLVSSTVSSARTMSTVSLRFLPLIRTVSPRNSCSFSIVAVCIDTTELSSLVASSTMSRLGDDLRRRMAVAVSSVAFSAAGCAITSSGRLAKWWTGWWVGWGGGGPPARHGTRQPTGCPPRGAT
eukprot:Unigene1729_Nuclearia_a/m.5310 Unigene1729_Nuclearia_a/g.5310  ORF Unigene1729_Nuclearia_a/g.5310 Unigene1729_Nuclearia_a/m.5310 type:complete len:430 (-) Unigene1729_Nuclearia_a:9-1298(-)